MAVALGLAASSEACHSASLPAHLPRSIRRSHEVSYDACSSSPTHYCAYSPKQPRSRPGLLIAKAKYVKPYFEGSVKKQEENQGIRRLGELMDCTQKSLVPRPVRSAGGPLWLGAEGCCDPKLACIDVGTFQFLKTICINEEYLQRPLS